MKLNVNKYFDEAKKNKISPFQLTFSQSTETTVSTFNDKVEEQTIGTSISLGGKGIVNGKLGLYSTDKIDNTTPQTLIENIIKSAKFGREEVKENFCVGSLKYKKAKIYSKDFKDANLTDLRKLALYFSNSLLKKDKRISKAEVTLAKVEEEESKYNDLGLKVKEKSRHYILYLSVVCEEKEDTRTGFDYTYSFESIDKLKEKGEVLVDTVIKKATDFFNSKPIKSAKYKAVLAPNVVSSLLKFAVSGLNAKSCQKHISPFENKKGEQIFSKYITIKHTPHIESTSSTSYDSDGYPTKDFAVVNKGVLTNYFHSIETARIDKVEANGCGKGLGEAGPFVLSLVPSRKSEEDLFLKAKKGIYITKVSGLNAGINGQTLNFSLPCEGYEIVDGKISKATSMIICAGNLKDLFMDVISVANNVKEDSGVFTPSILVKNLAISGK